jgi:cbb3-type cytochrome oxidase subunit 1
MNELRRAARSLSIVLSRPRAIALGSAVGLVAAATIAIPTAVIPNPLFTRMTPTRPLDVVLLVLTAIAAGLVGATYAAGTASPSCERRAGSGGILAFLAIGCPICNKVVVAVLGTAGALTYFEPLQPVLGLAGLALLLAALHIRLRMLASPTLATGPLAA